MSRGRGREFPGGGGTKRSLDLVCSGVTIALGMIPSELAIRIKVGAVKRINDINMMLRQANRAVDPLSGRLMERPPGFDLRLLPDSTTPIAPWVEQLIVTTVNEAITLNLPLLDALERLTTSLERGGIILSVDDLQWLLGASSGQFSQSLAS